MCITFKQIYIVITSHTNGFGACHVSLQKGYVVLLREYYDSATRRGAVVRNHQGLTQKWIYKYKTAKEDLADLEYSYLIDENQHCSKPNTHMRYFAYDYMHSVNPGHYTGPSRLLKFLTAENQEYVNDNTTVRLIPADHWKACVRNGRMELDFYFSKKTEKTPCGKRGIPLRVDMYSSDLTKVHEFHNSYDFMFYRPGRVRDQSVFEVPKGVVCHGIYGKKVRPPAPQSFSANIVMVYPNIKFSMIRRQHFDHKAKLSTYDITIRPGTEYAKRFGVNTVNIVHDYNTGIQYIIDAKRKNCTIEAVGKDKDNNYDFDGPWDPSHILLNHTSEIFDLTGFNLSYQGQRVERDIPVEVWAAKRDRFPQVWLNSTVEVYYTKANWMSEAGSHGERNVLIGLYHKTLPDFPVINQRSYYDLPENTHVYNYRGTQPDFSVFDVQPCFKDPKHYKRVSFYISVDKLTSVAGRRRTRLERAARGYVANVTGVELLRVNRLKIGKSTDNEIEVRFNLLEWLQPKEGTSPAWNNRVSLDKAMAKLLDAIGSSGKEPIRLSDRDSLKNIYVKRGSLAVSSGPLQTTAVITHGYSTVALVGIGFGMVIVGGVLGLAIAFTLWKTRLLLPYFPH
ncbi:hypothetical protein NP493_147g04039 [Ridgeia piscesae]|uniref:LolA-like domain-containing protein n=1 Tax=Ridgeia piscesae TaxID=27915 RepID=A0AAD9P4K8_RIDPI|nr:hypothetical protein NP493_147g04039 [Ridgeia piscesae]